MKKGTVKFFNKDKGFGFIKVDNSTEEVFVHANDLNGLIITEGDQVEFDTAQGKKGLNAIEVNKI